MRVCFCVWCVKCAKYLAFGTFERADENALREQFVCDLFIGVKSALFFESCGGLDDF